MFDDTVVNDSDDKYVHESECYISEVGIGCANVEQDIFDWEELEDKCSYFLNSFKRLFFSMSSIVKFHFIISLRSAAL
jgi:hypothetical protein